jgi:hypothetical protein
MADHRSLRPLERCDLRLVDNGVVRPRSPVGFGADQSSSGE